MRKSATENIFETVSRKKPVSFMYRLSIGMCIAVLLFSVVVFVYINRSKESEASIIPSFETALNEGRYDDALSMYRELHDNVAELLRSRRKMPP